MILLDTNAVIAILNGQPLSVRERLAESIRAKEEVAISSIVLFELHYDVARSQRKAKNAERIRVLLSGPVNVLAFDEADAKTAGELRATLEGAGTPIGPFDVLIAGQALRRGATFVTANTREFRRVPGLGVEDWASSTQHRR